MFTTSDLTRHISDGTVIKSIQGRDLSVDFALDGRVGKPAWVCREFCVMKKKESSKHALLLNQALNTIGVETVLEYWDGHKHVDIFVPAANLCIEVDGHNHYTSALQIVTDFRRSEHSAEDGLHTFRIPNEEIEKEVMKVARAIQKVCKR